MGNGSFDMRRLLEFVMITNAALFFFGAVQHAGSLSGRFTSRALFRPQSWKRSAGFHWRVVPR